MTRCLLIVLDSVGAGAAPDAALYGDAGADTLGSLNRRGLLQTPCLFSLGLDRILGLQPETLPQASYGRMRPRSAGKDSVTGHWEIAGVELDAPFATFEHFPAALVSAIETAAGTRFIGNQRASGTAILDVLGPEHLRSGRPILYTSADSVLQIAAHEAVMATADLYSLCATARQHADAWRIARVIARPFTGTPGSFRRSDGRHDYAMLPPPTVLDALADAGIEVSAIGKTADLFGGRGISRSFPTANNAAGMATALQHWKDTHHGLVFLNLLDFDTVYGHRRDPTGYAQALTRFDRWLEDLLPYCAPEDLVIITADHGNDPSFPGTDHTREEVPLLLLHQGRREALGTRDGFADVAASLAMHFALPPWPTGRSLLM